MLNVSVKITEDRWKEVEALLRENLAEVVAKTAQEVKAHAVTLCPVGPDRENHVHMRDTIEVAEIDPLHAQVEVGAEYGLFVELGTYKMDPKPFLCPAADLERDSFYAAVEAAVRSVG